MITLSLSEIAAAVGGDVVDASADLPVTAPPFVDSRRVVPGGLFVAVAGERVDGHAYAVDAVAHGAAAALVAHPVRAPAVVVDDPVRALGRLAQHLLGRLPLLRVIGITGSQGKTGTKDMLAQLLERLGETVSPVGSLNNEIGVPLTALRVTEATRFLVVELGARGRGHIDYLCSLVRPTVAVVLNVGVAHIGEFGSRDEIAAAKVELVRAVPVEGLVVLNADDERVIAMRDQSSAPVMAFGTAGDADVRLLDIGLDAAGHAEFVLQVGADSVDVTVQMVGEHQAHNAAAAASAALGLGMPLVDVADALRRVVPRSPWRMEVTTTAAGVTVINDAYNANPDSVRAALRALRSVGVGAAGRTVAVLGEMLELGNAGGREHDAVGRLVAELGIARLVVVGDGARAVHLGATAAASWAGESVSVADGDAALAYLRGSVQPGDVVLVKASRDVGLERVAAGLLDEPVPT